MMTNRTNKAYGINSASVCENTWGISMPVFKNLNPASEVKA